MGGAVMVSRGGASDSAVALPPLLRGGPPNAQAQLQAVGWGGSPVCRSEHSPATQPQRFLRSRACQLQRLVSVRSGAVDLAPRQNVSTQLEGECALQSTAYRHHDRVSVREIRRRICRYDVTTFRNAIKREATCRIAALSRRSAIQHDLDVA